MNPLLLRITTRKDLLKHQAVRIKDCLQLWVGFFLPTHQPALPYTLVTKKKKSPLPLLSFSLLCPYFFSQLFSLQTSPCFLVSCPTTSRSPPSSLPATHFFHLFISWPRVSLSESSPFCFLHCRTEHSAPGTACSSLLHHPPAVACRSPMWTQLHRIWWSLQYTCEKSAAHELLGKTRWRFS